jgi:hypothetical protein
VVYNQGYHLVMVAFYGAEWQIHIEDLALPHMFYLG